jgi:hypothetical protein
MILNSLSTRYCLPRVRNRGHGLGNEMIPWARAFLASQVLGAKLLPPAFGMNRRGYWRHFGTAPDDWIFNRAIETVFPVVEFTEADWLRHGGGDVVAALRGFADANGLHGRSVYVLVTDDLWGGYHHIQMAREFVRSTLYRSRFAARNLHVLAGRLDPAKILVGMHVRLGDFAPAGQAADYRHAASMALPMQWYRGIAEALQRAWGYGWQLLLVSDGEQSQLQPLLEDFPCVITGDLPDGDCSDALALAGADLLVCSVSSYSVMAAFLSDAPYLWFAPNLHLHKEGFYAAEGDAPASAAAGPMRRAVDYFLHESAQQRAAIARGTAIDVGAAVPAAVLEAAQHHHRWRRWELDLVRGGIAPIA